MVLQVLLWADGALPFPHRGLNWASHIIIVWQTVVQFSSQFFIHGNYMLPLNPIFMPVPALGLGSGAHPPQLSRQLIPNCYRIDFRAFTRAGHAASEALHKIHTRYVVKDCFEVFRLTVRATGGLNIIHRRAPLRLALSSHPRRRETGPKYLAESGHVQAMPAMLAALQALLVQQPLHGHGLVLLPIVHSIQPPVSPSFQTAAQGHGSCSTICRCVLPRQCGHMPHPSDSSLCRAILSRSRYADPLSYQPLTT